MEHLTEQKSIKPNLSKLTNDERIFLTARDLEIISYVCDMKFAGIEDLHFKFFKTLKNGSTSNSLWWARERLSALEKDGFIERKYAFDERTSYYLGTLKWYKNSQPVSSCRWFRNSIVTSHCLFFKNLIHPTNSFTFLSANQVHFMF